MKRSINRIGGAATIIFAAIALNSAATSVLTSVFTFESSHFWTPKLAYAFLLLPLSSAAAPLLLSHSRNEHGTGALVLEVLEEVSGWAWVGALEHSIVGHHPDDRAERLAAAGTVLGYLALVVPLYMLCAGLLRRTAGANHRTCRHLAEYDVGVAGYVVGFATNVMLSTLILGMWMGGDPSISFFFFLIELSAATKALGLLEAASARIAEEGSELRAASRAGLHVVERALGVAVGFAWLSPFRSLYDALIYYAFGDSPPEQDDATWLHVHEEEEEEEEVVRTHTRANARAREAELRSLVFCGCSAGPIKNPTPHP